MNSVSNSGNDLQERSMEERTEISMVDVHEQCHSAPTSEQNDEENVDVEFVSDEVNVEDNEQGDGQAREDDGNEGDFQSCDEDEGDEQGREVSGNEESSLQEVEVIVVGSDESRQDREKGRSNNGDSSTSFSSSTDSSDSGGEVGKYLARGGGDAMEEEQGESEQELDALDAFNALGPREVDIAMRPAIELPRAYEDWVSPNVLKLFSQYRTGDNMYHFISKINRKGMIFDVEGMGETEHVATWPGALKFVMYDIVVNDMNIFPPFTKF